jgi:hypothetical protein
MLTKLFTKKTAAEYLGININQLDTLIEMNWITPSQLGKRTYRFTENQLLDLLDRAREEQYQEQ